MEFVQAAHFCWGVNSHCIAVMAHSMLVMANGRWAGRVARISGSRCCLLHFSRCRACFCLYSGLPKRICSPPLPPWQWVAGRLAQVMGQADQAPRACMLSQYSNICCCLKCPTMCEWLHRKALSAWVAGNNLLTLVAQSCHQTCTPSVHAARSSDHVQCAGCCRSSITMPAHMRGVKMAHSSVL